MSRVLARATVFGKPGEIVQARPAPCRTVLLASAPSPRLASTVTVTLGDGGAETLPPKARRAVLAFLRRHPGRPSLRGLAFHRESRVPAGKGLGSSSADVLAALSVCAALFGGADRAAIYRLAATVEPTDPLLGGAMFDSTRGVVVCDVPLPDHDRVWWDACPDRTVDTVEASARAGAEPGACALLDRTERALRAGDLPALMAAATESARRSQARLLKPDFARALDLAGQLGGGVFTAHSGTLLGLLLPPGRAGEAARLAPRRAVAEEVRAGEARP